MTDAKQKQSVWYNEEKDELYLVDKKLRTWFADNMFWKTYCDRSTKERRIKTKSELHERMWEGGYVYIGEFE